MNLINEQLPQDQKRKQIYWICKEATYKGIVTRLLIQYREERFRQQELGNNPMQ